MNNRTTKILIIRRSALGDTIHTLPLAAVLREKFPNAEIDWIVEDKAAQFIENNPLLNKVYVIHKKTGGMKELVSLIQEIRQKKYDIAIDTQQLLKSGIILGMSGAKRRIALSDGREFSGIFANEIIKTNRPQFDINYHVIKRNLEIAEYLGADTENISFVLPESTQEAKQKAQEVFKKLNNNKKTIIIAPETTWKNKHWQVENWRELIKIYKDKTNILYTGTKNDKGLSKEILSGFNEEDILNLQGKTNLAELPEIFKLADLVISPDSGSAHIAWATGKPSIITLFFATSAERTAPFGEKYYSVQADCNCSPCMKKICRQNDKNVCTKKINLQTIVKLVNKVLQFD